MSTMNRREVFTSLFRKKSQTEADSSTCTTVKEDAIFKADIDVLSCMAWHNSICNSCLDSCDERAIKFLGMFRPNIDTLKCTGCNECTSVCPSNAISLKEVSDA